VLHFEPFYRFLFQLSQLMDSLIRNEMKETSFLVR
jgi:hypothetical protein